MAGERVTSVLHDAVADYLTIRRALGYKLIDHEWMLADFATYLEQAGASTITTELALAWAARTRGNESWKAARLSVVRGFARHLHTIDPTAEIPPTGVLIHRKRPAIPYVYSDAEINRLLGAAEVLTPPLRAATYYTLIGLLAVAGMRISEAIALDHDDVDLQAGVLTIRLTKFAKSRQLPLHSSTTAALANYDTQRNKLYPAPTAPSFFVSTCGTRLCKRNVQHTFRVLCRRVGLEGPDRHQGRGCTICATRSRCAPFWTGTAPALTRKPECCGCRPTWATSNRHRPTGT